MGYDHPADFDTTSKALDVTKPLPLPGAGKPTFVPGAPVAAGMAVGASSGGCWVAKHDLPAGSSPPPRGGASDDNWAWSLGPS